jgi:hypothetical protein
MPTKEKENSKDTNTTDYTNFSRLGHQMSAEGPLTKRKILFSNRNKRKRERERVSMYICQQPVSKLPLHDQELRPLLLN